jgi:predicted nucleic acid-binding protein
MPDRDAMVVDASVWVAAFDPMDSHHQDSVAFLRAVEAAGVPLSIPAVALVETGCAIARRTGSSSSASDATRVLMNRRSLTIEPMSAALLATAIEVGIQHRLRGGDAVYVATARVTGGQLIAWDRELLERGDAIAPTAWVASRS